MYNCSDKYKYENLLEDFEKRNSGVALLVIDLQGAFCNPKKWGSRETVKISKNINTFAEEFRKASIPVYSIYCDLYDTLDSSFYNYEHKKQDVLIRKRSLSAFRSSFPDLKLSLDQKGIKTVVACGVYKNACIKETVIDAKGIGFNTFLLEDLSCDDRWDRKQKKMANIQMLQHGIQFINSSQLLKDMTGFRSKGFKFNV